MTRKTPDQPVRATARPWAEPTEARLTRAMNLTLSEQEVIDGCRRKEIAISAIETLLSGGTHLVCLTIEGADSARHLFRQSIVAGPVRRASFQRVEMIR